MKLQAEVQEAVLFLLCHDDETAPVLTQLVPVETFDVYYREIAEAAVSHRSRFERVPGEHTYDLVMALGKQRPDAADAYQAIFDSMSSFKEGIQPDFVLSKAREFARWQTLQGAWVEMGRGLERDDDVGLQQAEGALSTALAPLADLFDPGMSMADVDSVERILEESNSPIIPCGIPEIDSRRAGPARGRLNCLMASTGKGKSWWLVHVAKAASKRGFRVLYLTMEMDDVEVCQRVYQSFFSVSEKEAVDKVHKIRKTSSGLYDGITEIQLPGGARPTLKDDDARDKLYRNLDRANKAMSRIRIKHMPQNQVTVGGIEALLDTLGNYEGFFPDAVLIDYADLMKKDPRDIRGSLRLIYEDLKSLAQRRNIAVCTVTQSNRSGMNVETLNEEQMSEDFSKAQTADSLITYNQTESEHAIGFARLFVAKNRRGQGLYYAAITQNYALGQFCLSSSYNSSRIESDVKAISGYADEEIKEAVQKKRVKK